ncbi:Crp/Fnr family transcriptional regulator [Cytophaga hutchinsonii]|uniref:Cyclic nucleotide binding regulatory protein n=1 Tax=Cytophaga hutchinsonii (strain ATCC 33406 / DSM 1761 / CIP 103989 / NBRC 15051 / NCIMB 9469 / D465) TaxID=269798 RepID=A0A6N4SPX6_CYTH3|nr:Crp/Fnr family transcriptional regulator [Cytophaga hutchinsonii]ABG58398.1 cyclic nucleotide binding regulatory protein [Cytophaga hutchinsonii ATCC 33406]SFX50964.1 cAMP-binding domain of CRP or a regulatory subunit of cAMP-dependent protein kinases [Cytophaga hutchinsonii ATCC 33406]
MIEFLKSLQILSDNELQKINAVIKTKFLKKNGFLIKEGAVCDEIAWIKTGILRSYYSNVEGKETTKCIAFENELTAAYSSFITQEPTFENIHALCDSELLVLKRTDLYALYAGSAEWQNVGRILTELHYIDLEKRTVSFQKQTGKERYEALAAEHSKYIKFIPLKHLSSFLGITPRHLSRLRNGS